MNIPSIADPVKIGRPFPFYGSKKNHLSLILPNLPVTKHYCEPFGGSGSILLSRQPSQIETYNDIDGGLVNFFKVIRNDLDEFTRLISLTPYSREEFEYDREENVSDVEAARRFFLSMSANYVGRPRGKCFATCTNDVISGVSNRIKRHLNHINNLSDIAARLLCVQIENMDAIELIKRYDTSDTLFYCDPPYPSQSRTSTKVYDYELDDDYHINLSSVLHKIEGKAAISGYRCPLYDDLFSDWTRLEGPINRYNNNRSERQEILWVNYEVSTHERIGAKVKQTKILDPTEAVINV